MSAKYPGSLKLYGKRILDGSKTFAASGSSKSFWDYLFYPSAAVLGPGIDIGIEHGSKATGEAYSASGTGPTSMAVDVGLAFGVADISPSRAGEVVR